MFTNPNQDDFVACPYNSEHLVKYKRLSYHLIKCRESYFGLEIKSCPFNALHMVPITKYLDHISICEHRTSLQRNIRLEIADFPYRFNHCTNDGASHDWEPDLNEKKYYSDDCFGHLNSIEFISPPTEYQVQPVDYFHQIYPIDDKSSQNDENEKTFEKKLLSEIGRDDKSSQNDENEKTIEKKILFGIGRGKRI